MRIYPNGTFHLHFIWIRCSKVRCRSMQTYHYGVYQVSNIYMFAGAESFSGNGLEAWDFSHVIYADYMFLNATSFDANLSKWDVLNITNMTFLFANTSQFYGEGLQNWELNPSVYPTGIFCNASEIQAEYIISWNELLDDAFC
jgi:Mycoplasma protein of unknown function, DUF285